MESLGSIDNVIVVGLLQPDNSGALAYALRRGLVEPSHVRKVRPVTQLPPLSQMPPRDPAAAGPIDVSDIEGEASDVLIAEGRGARVMVVQTPHDAATALDDPVLSRLRRSAPCLLVEVDADGQVVRASGPHGEDSAETSSSTSLAPAIGPAPSADVVVGFDGSASSVEAVRWAIASAQEDSLTVQVVMAYQPGDPTPEDPTFADRGKELTQSKLEQASRDIPLGRATLIQSAVPGEPSDVLLNYSQNSRVLVLGRHGTNGMIHSALGSVGDTCARLATCPVVIVPA